MSQKYLNTRFISISSTGLPDDIINIWADLGMAIQLIDMRAKGLTGNEFEEDDLESLNTLRCTYEEYADEKYSPEFRERIKQLLNYDNIALFNSLVREFNELAARKAVTVQIAQDFLQRATALIRGK